MLTSFLESRRERMSSVDTAWLRMERPNNLMMITGVMVFADRLELARARQVFEARFLGFSRFRQRAVTSSRGAYWEMDPDFDIASHVRRVALPGAAGKEELEEMASDLASQPLDYSKPLWQVHLVEDYQGGSALILRIHHCYADGIALIQVLLSMTDASPEGRAAGKGRGRLRAARGHKDEGGLQRFVPDMLKPLYAPAARWVEGAVKAGEALRDEATGILREPSRVADYSKVGLDVAGELAKLAVMRNDPDTRFKGRPGARKRVAWAEPIPLDEVKAVGRALGCTVNDVLLSCVTGALRDYLLDHGDDPDGLTIRAVVPVNLRPLEDAHHLGNHFGLVMLELPIGIENPLERLFRVKSNMEALKGSYQAVVAFGLLGAIGLGPAAVQSRVLDLLSKKATAVMTNVPGPQQPLYLGGARIAQQMFWVPQSGNIGMGVSILSYDGGVQFGLITDAKLVADPEAVIGRFGDEFEKLVLGALMEPWEGEEAARAAE